VSIGYKTDVVIFFQISRTLQRKWHAKRTSGAPRNDPQVSAPQKLPYIKMALAWIPFSINLLFLSSMASNRAGLYRFEVGYPFPTSSQNLGSKNGENPLISGKNQIENPKLYKITTFLDLIWAQAPYAMRAPPCQGHMGPYGPALAPRAMHWPFPCSLALGLRALHISMS
jgi:hypothetical protein